MSSITEQFNTLLCTFTSDQFRPAAETARRLLETRNILLSRSNTPVPTRELEQTYARRAINPRLRRALAKQCDQLVQIAKQYPDERWHIYIIAIEDEPQIALFSNEEDIGRVCLDHTAE